MASSKESSRRGCQDALGVGFRAGAPSALNPYIHSIDSIDWADALSACVVALVLPQGCSGFGVWSLVLTGLP